MTQRETYPVEVNGVKRDLRLFEVKPGLKIAILNILGDTEFVAACAKQLNEELGGIDYNVLVTAEAKSIPLIHMLAVEAEKPYVVLRKAYKVYMGRTIEAKTVSITTGREQTLYLDEKDHELVRGRNVVIVDDVVSSGSTLKGMRQLMEKAGAEIAAEAAIFTEGDEDTWEDIVSLGHLPVFVEDE